MIKLNSSASFTELLSVQQIIDSIYQPRFEIVYDLHGIVNNE